jgi:hypothetical protein
MDDDFWPKCLDMYAAYLKTNIRVYRVSNPGKSNDGWFKIVDNMSTYFEFTFNEPDREKQKIEIIRLHEMITITLKEDQAPDLFKAYSKIEKRELSDKYKNLYSMFKLFREHIVTVDGIPTKQMILETIHINVDICWLHATNSNPLTPDQARAMGLNIVI